MKMKNTKKRLFRKLEKLAPFDVTGFYPLDKKELKILIRYFKK